MGELRLGTTGIDSSTYIQPYPEAQLSFLQWRMTTLATKIHLLELRSMAWCLFSCKWHAKSDLPSGCTVFCRLTEARMKGKLCYSTCAYIEMSEAVGQQSNVTCFCKHDMRRGASCSERIKLPSTLPPPTRLQPFMGDTNDPT